MGKYHYVIDNQSHPGRYYIGFTENLDDRLQHHNAGAVPCTKAYRPWVYRTCIAFTDRQRALDFERLASANISPASQVLMTTSRPFGAERILFPAAIELEATMTGA